MAEQIESAREKAYRAPLLMVAVIGSFFLGYASLVESSAIGALASKPKKVAGLHELGIENLLDLLNVLGRLVALEPTQSALLDAILAGRLIDSARLA